MKCLLLATALLVSIPVAASAQDGHAYRAGAVAGSNEITLSGTGSSDNDFDSGSFGVSGSYGYFLSNALELGARQSITWAGSNNSDDSWAGGTRIFLDYHFLTSQRFRPFIGASVGYIYGDGVNDTGTIGPELGIKYFVNDSTFLLAMAEYQWFFDNGDEVGDNFDDGAFQYTVGLGFIF